MKKIATLFVALALCMGLAVPAFAVERSESTGYTSYQFDGVKAEERQVLSFGHPDPDAISSYDTDGYIIEKGTEFTVTNIYDSPTGFVYIECEVYVKQPYMMNELTGAQVAIPGGYFFDVDEEAYYLGVDGSWVNCALVYARPGVLTSDFGGTEIRGKLLYQGQSTTFTLPDRGDDSVYVVYVSYYDEDDPNLGGGSRESVRCQ